ncbi:phasin family protein [Bradyrhizobium viridifuturi]|uniref:phasin family protein n=1 Tax=uncultured Bradyrhizobium sp. TaxID=199684 RepID=UPI001BAAD632|nr:phasin family protein [uncultured Bradyrhizobium sp.]MBR1040715.1 phasin family protein [Bradyrhizobium viridifuturi]MBR1075003.1 phasin family protein [Bradyrhizobium viridifuturi]
MAEEKIAASGRLDTPNFSLLSVDWLKKMSETPQKFYFDLYRGAFSAIARQLQDQADYVRKLSEITQPTDALACHSEFARKTVAGWVDEGRQIFGRSLETMTPDKK